MGTIHTVVIAYARPPWKSPYYLDAEFSKVAAGHDGVLNDACMNEYAGKRQLTYVFKTRESAEDFISDIKHGYQSKVRDLHYQALGDDFDLIAT